MTVIKYHDVVPLLVEAVPSFRRQWEAFQAEAKASGDEILPYIVVGDLALYLHKLARTGETGEFAALFDVIERVLLEGEHSAAELAHIGMLEDLCHPADPEGNPELFVPWLRPESAQSWQAILDFYRMTGGQG